MEQRTLEHLGPTHVGASLTALSECCEIVSTRGRIRRGDAEAAGHDLDVRVGFVDHGAFLSPLLQGFTVFHATSNGVLTGPGQGEIVYAVSLTQPVESQIQTVLSFFGTLIERQTLINRGEYEVTELEQSAQDLDLRTMNVIDDRLRRDDWRNVASGVRTRAESSGFNLKATVASPLLSADEISARSPVLRRVYNELEPVRSMVDRVAGLFSSALTLHAPGVSEAAFSHARNLLDLGDLRRYSAHQIRDVHVCGNGYLLLLPPPAGPRLVMAEDIWHDGHTWIVRGLDDAGTRSVDESSILHLQGMHQTEGRFGMSLLEPFVMHLAQIDVMQDVIENSPRVAALGGDQGRRWVERIEPFARAQIADALARTEEVLAGGAQGLPEPPGDLYFPGHELMSRSAPRLTYMGPTDE